MAIALCLGVGLSRAKSPEVSLDSFKMTVLGLNERLGVIQVPAVEKEALRTARNEIEFSAETVQVEDNREPDVGESIDDSTGGALSDYLLMLESMNEALMRDFTELEDYHKGIRLTVSEAQALLDKIGGEDECSNCESIHIALREEIEGMLISNRDMEQRLQKFRHRICELSSQELRLNTPTERSEISFGQVTEMTILGLDDDQISSCSSLETAVHWRDRAAILIRARFDQIKMKIASAVNECGFHSSNLCERMILVDLALKSNFGGIRHSYNNVKFYIDYSKMIKPHVIYMLEFESDDSSGNLENDIIFERLDG